MKRQWEHNSRHGTTRRRRGSSGWGLGGQRWMGDKIRQRWMGDEIRQSLPDHVERNMQPQRMHNRNVHRQSSSGGEGVGQRWVPPDMRYSQSGGGGPNMEHGLTDNWVAPNMRYIVHHHFRHHCHHYCYHHPIWNTMMFLRFLS
jgi:hypothetical protein